MSNIVLTGLAAVCTAALAGCVGHPATRELPNYFVYELHTGPEQATRSMFGTLRVDAPAGFSHLKLVSRLPEQVAFEYRCHVRGVDAIPQWVGDGQDCAAGAAPYVQALQVRLAGPAARYYRVRYECQTATRDGGMRRQSPVHRHAGDWCGTRDSAADEWIAQLVVHVDTVHP